MQLRLTGMVELFTTYGFSLIPLQGGEKTPTFKEVKPYLDGDTRLTREELINIFNTNPHYNLGVVLGKPSDNLCVLDFEDWNDAITFYPNLMEMSCKTLIVKTPHHGAHIYMKTLDTDIGRRIRVAGKQHPFDLLSAGYIVAPPSIISHAKCVRKKEEGGKNRCFNFQGASSYEVMNSYELTLVNIENIVKSVTDRCNVLKWLELKVKTDLIGKPASCGLRTEIIVLATMLNTGRKYLSHASRVAVATEMVKCGYTDDDIQALFSTAEDYNQVTCESQIQSIRRRPYTYSHEALRELLKAEGVSDVVICLLSVKPKLIISRRIHQPKNA